MSQLKSLDNTAAGNLAKDCHDREFSVAIICGEQHPL